MLLLSVIVGVLALCSSLRAADWTWQWNLGIKSDQVKVDIAPFQYGKQWAYSIEIDDGPASTLTVVEPLIKQFYYTDAPVGISGGKLMRFEGGMAIIVSSVQDKGNLGERGRLGWDNLHTLLADGWGLISHSYYHKGRSWGKPPEILSAEQFREDFFWSQSIFAAELTDGRAPTHLVYPNGYTDYSKHFKEFGLISGSLVSGGPANPVYKPGFNMHRLTRTYLDEGYWKNGGKAEPMFGFPKNGPEADQLLFIDFTHGISADQNSDNYKRWKERLSTIADTYAAKGKDNVWVAPTGDVVDYVTARKTASVKLEDGTLSVSLPETGPGSRLTLHLSNLPAGAKLAAPQGAIVYQKGTEAWITTPMIGLWGTAAPLPHVKRYYAGEVKDLSFDKPLPIAAVRLFYTSPPPKDFQFLVEADGKSLVPSDFKNPTGAWNIWQLFAVVPNQPAIVARTLKVKPLKGSLQRMEVWVVDE